MSSLNAIQQGKVARVVMSLKSLTSENAEVLLRINATRRMGLAQRTISLLTNVVKTNFFRVIDHCIAEGPEGLKREILKNGPVIGML
jgi:hypothetical protein